MPSLDRQISKLVAQLGRGKKPPAKSCEIRGDETKEKKYQPDPSFEDFNRENQFRLDKATCLDLMRKDQNAALHLYLRKPLIVNNVVF